MRHVRAFILYNKLPERKAIARATRLMSKNMFLDEDRKLWRKTKNGVKVEILDTMDRLRGVLLMIHDGMGHRAMGSCYALFQQRFWVPESWSVKSY